MADQDAYGPAELNAKLEILLAEQMSARVQIDAMGQKIDEVLGQLLLVQTRLLHELNRQIIPLDDGLVAVRHQVGWWIIPREEYAFLLHFANGSSVHEAGTLALLRSLLREGDHVIDVGAHLGFLAVPMAQCIGSSGRVVAIEPFPRNVECLRRTLQSNGLAERCDLLEMAASDQDAPVELFTGENSMMGSIAIPHAGHSALPVVAARLDSTIDPGTRIDLIKIDAEGAEMRVLAGMQRIVSDNPDVFVIAEFGISHLRDIGIDPEDWLAAFRSVGLDSFRAIDDTDASCTAITITELCRCFSRNLIFGRADNPRWSEIIPGAQHL